MKIEGSFVNKMGSTITVSIVIAGSTSADISIEPGSDLEYAAEDAVTIDGSINDSLDAVLQHSCTINLHALRYVPELFAKEYKDVAVTVKRGDAIIFSGWLEPRTFSQPFNERYDDLSLSCVDSLSSLQYSPFRGVNDSTTYTAEREKTALCTFDALIKECLKVATGGGDYTLIYDDSRALPDGEASVLFSSLSVSTMAFLGDDADDCKTYLEVLEALMKYLDLHIVQIGTSFYIFSWETIRKGNDKTITLSADNVADMDTQLDVQEVFNQLSLTVSPKGDDTVIKSPLDSSGRIPAMGGRQYYVTEYAADGNKVEPARAFFDLIKGHSDSGYNSQVWKDWLIRVMRNVYWKIGSGSGIDTVKGELSEVTDWVAAAIKDSTQDNPAYPEDVTDKLRTNLGALLVQVGTLDHKPGTGDTSRQTTISMTDELIISVNGNEDDTNTGHYPTDDAIKAAMPLMSYEGGDSTAVYSPSVADVSGEGYHNYLVIDGTLTLCPIMDTSFEVEKVRKYSSGDDFWNNYVKDNNLSILDGRAGILAGVSPSRVDKHGRYLAFEWWKKGAQTGTRKGYVPYTQDGPELYEYKTSDGKDTVEKVDILWCMLRIGDMVLVEDRSKQGGVDAFSWQTYKTLAECGGNTQDGIDAYLQQTFTIGINPKIGDKLIGTDFNVASNFDYDTNISADKGMAIPLPYDAKLHGKMIFQILGIDNPVWADYHVTRHHTMFRHTKYGTSNIPLMAHVSDILIKDFSVKLYSDVADDGDSDIVYMSRCSHTFYNKKDDLEFLVHSGFTADEMSAYGLSGKMMYTSVVGPNGAALLNIDDKISGESGKPEKLYVSHYYDELHQPRIILTQNVIDDEALTWPLPLYQHAALGKNFYVRSVGRNLMDGTESLSLEETY